MIHNQCFSCKSPHQRFHPITFYNVRVSTSVFSHTISPIGIFVRFKPGHSTIASLQKYNSSQKVACTQSDIFCKNTCQVVCPFFHPYTKCNNDCYTLYRLDFGVSVHPQKYGCSFHSSYLKSVLEIQYSILCIVQDFLYGFLFLFCICHLLCHIFCHVI